MPDLEAETMDYKTAVTIAGVGQVQTVELFAEIKTRIEDSAVVYRTEEDEEGMQVILPPMIELTIMSEGGPALALVAPGAVTMMVDVPVDQRKRVKFGAPL